MLTGAAAGGVSAEMSGGDFTQGAIQGAWTAAIADLVNNGGKKLQAQAAKLRALYAAKNKPVQGSFMEISRSVQAANNSGNHTGEDIAAIKTFATNAVEAFRPRPDLVESYLYSDYVQGQFRAFSEILIGPPTIEGAVANNLMVYSFSLSKNPMALTYRGAIAITEYYIYYDE
jgi:hypothetical protein